jgi:hypothetical protein
MEKMEHKIFSICPLVLSFALLLSSSFSFGSEVFTTLIYSSNTLGEVDPSC